jgi:hypothetical protein
MIKSPQRGTKVTKNLFVSFVLFCGLNSFEANAQSNRSVYTSLGEKQCRTIKSAMAGDDGYEARCRGTAGYTLLLSEGDLRQNITVIIPQGTKHSLDLWSVISGGFSSVGPKAEWRIAKQKPTALIIRYNASEDPEQPNKLTSYLAVTKITASEICVTDKISPGASANEVARRAADESANKPCLKAQ